ncbi:uncharacterized protein LOC123292813 [Chrysoperla carnea]|uniref:uncharacterized protein LOC123292813 n=1 Tax=Chrysoperla carnea TaxID=189513 RepID=UPI001D08CB61|nr:uncharacterized protein LOC123292813 [Chrysoperla carnea]
MDPSSQLVYEIQFYSMSLQKINSTKNVKKKIISKLETPIEKFQTHLYNSLRIPDNVLLPEDEIFANSMDSNIVEELNLTISNLEKEILKTKYEIKKISSKTQKMENLSKEIEELKTSLMNFPTGDYDNNIAVDIFKSLMEMKQKAILVLSQNDTTENSIST